MRQLTEIYPERSGSTELRVQALVQVAAVQHLFLRAALNKEQLGLDFFDKEQRDALDGYGNRYGGRVQPFWP
jgi:hypothetical protein